MPDSRPVIGINCNFMKVEGDWRYVLNPDYGKSIQQAGGLPFLIPHIYDRNALLQLLSRLQGVLMTGGGDLNACHWNEPLHPLAKLVPESKEQADFLLVEAVLEQQLPLLGICLGCQHINVFRGGTVLQNIDEKKGGVPHREGKKGFPRHEVSILPGSRLFSILGVDRLDVNSGHHQAVRTVGKGLVASATANDGVIEAIEDPEHSFLMGVQWHPERLREEPHQQKVFDQFVEAAKSRLESSDCSNTARVDRS